MLEVSPAAIKKWIKQGKLAAFRTPGGHFRILADEFERFQKTHGFGTGTGDPLRVLVVDDQRDVTDVIVIRPDVLLLDLSMPGMDGFEVCRQIKRDPVIRDTKVAVMAAQSLDAEPRAMEAGADGFLSKPFAVDAVRGLLARLFGPRR